VECKVIKAPPEASLSGRAAAKGRQAAKRAAKRGGGNGSGASMGVPPSLAAAAAAAGGAPPRAFVSPGGHKVLVGRNNRQNDVLSTKLARAQDLWLHVRGLPGSHTLLRVEPGQPEPEPDDLQFAADLAAYYSKARDAGKADVIVARAGALRKFKGARPGQVLVAEEEGNVVGRPEQGAAVATAGAAVDG
jgi:NFACT protein RNA binding domain